MSADRTDEIRLAILRAKKRSWVAKLDEAMDLLWKAYPSLDSVARAVLEDLRKDMSMGHPWPVSDMRRPSAAGVETGASSEGED